MKRHKLLLFVIFLLFITSCTPQKIEAKTLVPTAIPIMVVTETASQSIEETVKVEEVTATENTPVVLQNPYAGRIWSQVCDQVFEDGIFAGVNCEESWAAEPLPGGCPSDSFNYKGSSGCSAAALAYIINTMLTPKEIEQVAGKGVYGITPDYLIDEVYTKLDPSIKMDCFGVSVPILRDTLSFFGLVVRTKNIGIHNLEKNIRPGEMALVGINMVYEGLPVEHWTVAMSFEEGRVVFADSLVGRGGAVVFNEETGVSSWEMTSLMLVSKTSP